MLPVARDANVLARVETSEEPFLERVVVERAVDVRRADRSERDALGLEQILGLKLTLMTRLGVCRVDLELRGAIRGGHQRRFGVHLEL